MATITSCESLRLGTNAVLNRILGMLKPSLNVELIDLGSNCASEWRKKKKEASLKSLTMGPWGLLTSTMEEVEEAWYVLDSQRKD